MKQTCYHSDGYHSNNTMLKCMERLRERRYLWQKVYKERLLLQIFSYFLWQFVEVLYQLLQLKRRLQLVHNIAYTHNKHSITFSTVPGAFCCTGPGELWTLSTPNVRVTRFPSTIPSTSTIFPSPSFTQPCSQLYGICFPYWKQSKA